MGMGAAERDVHFQIAKCGARVLPRFHEFSDNVFAHSKCISVTGIDHTFNNDNLYTIDLILTDTIGHSDSN